MKVALLCPTLCNPLDCSLPGSSVHGILQARILEWVAIPFSRGSSQPKNGTQVSQRQILYPLRHQGRPRSSCICLNPADDELGRLKVWVVFCIKCMKSPCEHVKKLHCTVASTVFWVCVCWNPGCVSAVWHQLGYLTFVSLILFLKKMNITPAWTLVMRIKWVNIRNCSNQSLIHNAFWGEDDWW